MGSRLCCGTRPRPLSRARSDGRRMDARAPLCAAHVRDGARKALRRVEARGRGRPGGGIAVNLLSPLPDARSAEQVDALLTRPGLRLERIVPLGQANAPRFWYDQAEGEWVLLLAGAVRLRFADETEARLLGPGDWLDISPHRRHRVDWT